MLSLSLLLSLLQTQILTLHILWLHSQYPLESLLRALLSHSLIGSEPSRALDHIAVPARPVSQVPHCRGRLLSQRHEIGFSWGLEHARLEFRLDSVLHEPAVVLRNEGIAAVSG